MVLKGRCAIVTGASLGIGLCIAEGLIARGVRVAGLARDTARLNKVAERLGDAFHPFGCDVGELSQVARAVRSVRDVFGRVDILINNAGIGRFGAIDELSKGDWDEMIATNLSGVFHCTREVVPIMKARGGGHIVNIVSIAGTVGYPNASGYNASKFAVRGFSDALCKELAEFSIKVSAVLPGSTDTMFSGTRLDANIPTMRPQAVAGVVLHVLESPHDLNVSEVVVRPLHSRQ